MRCIIREKESKQHSFGEPKEIVVDQREWQKDGQQGYTYSYHMSTERYERNQNKSYTILVTNEAGVEEVIGTLGYYEFVDFDYEDCIGDRRLESAAKELGVEKEAILQVIKEPLMKLQSQIRSEFDQTEEAIAKREHEEIFQKYHQAKREFSMQLGFQPIEYDRCYNVFGQLMDSEHLGRLKDIVKKREDRKHESKRYRKSQSQKRFHESLHVHRTVEYTEEEQVMLTKFYRLLAKKYHPDANPGIDTSQEMTLLNKVKKHWHI